MFMPSCVRTRAEFTINSFTADNRTAPSVSTFADGGFIAVWVTTDPTQDGDGNAIKAQLFDAAGSKAGIEFLVNSAANGEQFTPQVATLDNGNFLVTSVTNVSDDGTDGIVTYQPVPAPSPTPRRAPARRKGVTGGSAPSSRAWARP